MNIGWLPQKISGVTIRLFTDDNYEIMLLKLYATYTSLTLLINDIKVTRYLQRCLQRCLASKQRSTSALNCRYLNPYIKLKLIELAIQLNQEF